MRIDRLLVSINDRLGELAPNSGENIKPLTGDFMSDVITAIKLDAQETEDIENGRNEINADPFRGIQLN